MAAREKIDQVPKAWQSVHRAGAKALLRAEVTTLRDMLATTRAEIARVIAEVASLPDGVAPAATKAHALGAIRRGAAALKAGLGESILSGRDRGREAAAMQLDAELTVLRRELVRHGFSDGPDAPARSTGGAASDRASAEAAGASLAAAWHLSAVAAVTEWERAETRSLPPMLAKTATAMAPRVARTATTEVAVAFNDEHEDGTDEIAEKHSDAEWLPAVLKLWNALLDRACPVCAGHDGEITVIGVGFSGGDVPGSVHARCRCSESLVFLPLRIKKSQPEDEAA